MIKADQLLTRFDKNHKGVKVVVDEFGICGNYWCGSCAICISWLVEKINYETI